MQTRYGKYELKRPLGSGASGTVYCALDTFAGRDVALKVLDGKVLHDPRMGELTRGQFMNEAALAGRLSHPHIVAIYEAVMEDDAGYVAMEYVAGGNLLKFTQADRLLPVNDVVQIGFKSCSALDYAFRQGVIHRDIKPANILVSEGTNIKVADFGSALLRSAGNSDQIVGTPSYMSPEQMSGRELTHHSDMYAMGVVLYELLCGRKPFAAGTIDELFRKIATEVPPPPGKLRTGVPQRLDEIVLRMISKRPEDRYPTWAELALELAQVGRLSVYQREIADSEKFDYLCKSQIFGKLSDAHLWELVQGSRWSRLPPRTTILREDEAGSSMYLLGGGDLKVTRRGRLLNLLKSGECFGEMAFILGAAATRHATVEAMTDAVVAEFEPSGIARLSEGCRLQIAHGLLRTLVERLAMANARISQQ
ncbi:MAG: protein kinase [Burkholderiales bacterium]|nr:protein kinase [Burkholderiales bacterium]